MSSRCLIILTVSLKFLPWPLCRMSLFSFLFLIASHPPSLNTQLFLPPDWGHLAFVILWLSACSSQPSLSSKLTSSGTLSSLMWWGWEREGSYVSTFELLFLSGCVSASVAGAQNQSWEMVGDACPLSDGYFPSALGLPTVPFQQVIKSIRHPMKGAVISRENSKSCFCIYL